MRLDVNLNIQQQRLYGQATDRHEYGADIVRSRVVDHSRSEGYCICGRYTTSATPSSWNYLLRVDDDLLSGCERPINF